MELTTCVAHGTSDFREKQDERGDDRHVGVRHRGLSTDLGGDRSESTAKTLQDLRKHEFDIRCVGTSGMNHHYNAAIYEY